MMMYLPIISNSRFTRSPIFISHKFVISCVRGISQTVYRPDHISTTVRLTPLIVMLPFGIRLAFHCGSTEIVSFFEPSSASFVSVTVHVVSICPLTICPSSILDA